MDNAPLSGLYVVGAALMFLVAMRPLVAANDAPGSTEGGWALGMFVRAAVAALVWPVLVPWLIAGLVSMIANTSRPR